MAHVIDIGTRWEPLVDRLLIDRLDRATQRLNPPIRREVVFQVQHPNENSCTGCYNLVQDGDRILMYYRGYYPLNEPGDRDLRSTQTANLVISTDGIHFERPSLGLVEFNGSKDNNIVWRDIQSHNMVAFLDNNPAARSEERFKAVGGSGRKKLYGMTSPDGIHWRLAQEQPLDIDGAFDSVNVPLWDPLKGRYRLFSRYFIEEQRLRAIQSCESEDFLHWTAPVPHQYGAGVPMEHFYTNATVQIPGAEHILLSFPMRYVPARTRDTEGMDYPGPGVSDAIMMSSRDGVHWDRTFLEAWLRAGPDERNWTHRNQTPAVGIVQTASDEWSLYAAEHYGWDTNRLRRLSIPPMRLASVQAGYAGGELLTPPLTFAGRRLYLNYATSAVGSVQVEVCDPDGRPLQGLAGMEGMFGDTFDGAAPYDLSAVVGKPVRLRFRLHDADLYALRTGE
ncbi:MAG: hypothetical protein EXR62_10690 [Chloroflexi bacterium]|nr:hypothetical protein [Chloroflexota bacterium]